MKQRAEYKDEDLPESKFTRSKKILSSFLQKASLGQYKTPLYFNKWDYHSTNLSGIVTLICVLFIISFTIVEFRSIFLH
jgi:hypothetical protein